MQAYGQHNIGNSSQCGFGDEAYQILLVGEDQDGTVPHEWIIYNGLQTKATIAAQHCK